MPVHRGVSLVTAAALWAAGCQCSLDTSAIDDLRCVTTADCEPGLECVGEYCQLPGCQTRCAAGQTCVDARCVCDDPALAACGSSCVRTSSDPDHCGACDRECRAGEVCQQGECAGDCAEGFTDCSGACVDLLHDPAACGDCDTRCPQAQACLEGTCGACGEASDCDDGLDCTVDDCQDGACRSDLADGRCLLQGICLAGGDACADGTTCAPCAGGCVTPPTSLTVSCDETRGPGQEAVCSITSDEPTEAACLSCTALAGMTELLHESFDDCDPAAGGWTVSGGIEPICPLAEGALFPGTDAAALEADDGDWTIERRVDTSDFDTVRLCFDYGHRGADANTEFVVSVDSAGDFVEVFRETAPLLAEIGPAWLTRCLQGELGPDAVRNPDLGIRFMLETANDKDLYLDDVILEGWIATDLTEQTVFADDFAACDLAAWAIEDSDPNCPTEADGWAGQDAVEAMALTTRLSRRATGEPLCEDPWLVFGYGNSHTDAGEQLTVDLDLGEGWGLAWGNTLGAGPENALTPIGLGLAHIDPRARDNPDVGVRFTLVSNGGANRAVAIDDVVLRGQSCGPAGDRATLSAPVRVTDTSYSFAVSADEQITLHPVCTWGGEAEIAGTDRVTFRTP